MPAVPWAHVSAIASAHVPAIASAVAFARAKAVLLSCLVDLLAESFNFLAQLFGLFIVPGERCLAEIEHLLMELLSQVKGIFEERRALFRVYGLSITAGASAAAGAIFTVRI